jgi:hypothetical protein
MVKKKSPNKENPAAEKLMRMLFDRMQSENNAKALNANVIIPFAAALEEICQARGYHLNIHGEKSNIVFSGDEADAKVIYRLVEDYLAAKDKGG